eukprot:jgi/Bigna1/82950/fgenesh1_pg.99_\
MQSIFCGACRPRKRRPKGGEQRSRSLKGFKIPAAVPTSSRQIPPFMTLKVIKGLHLCMDQEALEEYSRNQKRYDEIFGHAWECLSKPLRQFGQVPIWIHGKKGNEWRLGYQLKLEEGVDMGEEERGMAWFGDMQYGVTTCWKEAHWQDFTVFIVNMEGAVLGHNMVLIHELTHAFHEVIGDKKLPEIRQMHENMMARKEEIFTKNAKLIYNRIQLDYNISNHFEFFAYCMEAYHSRPPSYSKLGNRFESPAFPRTYESLREMDNDFKLEIIATVEKILYRGESSTKSLSSRNQPENLSRRGSKKAGEVKETRAKTLIFIRHGESVFNHHAENKGGGDPYIRDAPLTEKGRRQAVASASKVVDYLTASAKPSSCCRVLSSPLSRAMHTALLTCPQFKGRVQLWPELREVITGCDDIGTPASELKASKLAREVCGASLATQLRDIPDVWWTVPKKIERESMSGAGSKDGSDDIVELYKNNETAFSKADKASLGERTSAIISRLAKLKESVIIVVSHYDLIGSLTEKIGLVEDTETYGHGFDLPGWWLGNAEVRVAEDIDIDKLLLPICPK